MITVTLGNIFNSVDTLGLLTKEKLGVKALYKLNKLVEALPKEIKFLDEQRLIIIKKYGEEVNNGVGTWKVKPEHIDEFNKEINDLLSIEVELPNEKFLIDELDDVKLDLIQYNTIKVFIKE